MKKMKKFFAMFLALAMVLGMSLMTFAEGEPKITVANLPDIDGVTVYYEKIAEAEPTTPLGWSLVEGITLSNEVSLEELAAVAGGNTNAATGTINGNQVVAQAIERIALSKTASVNETTAEITGVTPGLYVIEVNATGYTFTRMLAYVAWNDDNTAAVANTPVQAKGALDQVNKEITAVEDGDHTSVSAGDVVPFTVTAKYPYLAQNVANPTFVITDTVTGGTLQGNPTITIGGVTATDSDVTVEKTDTGFTATFHYNIAKASQDVVITYDVTVSEGVDPLTNRVSSQISSVNDGTPTETEAMVISPKVSATVGKISEGDVPLPGAKFALYVETITDATHIIKGGTIVEAGDGETATLKYITEGTTAIGEDEKAIVSFDGLDAQKTYYVVETEAPNGYHLNQNNVYQLTGAAVEAGTATAKWYVGTEEVTEGTDGARKVMVTENIVKSNFVANDGKAVVNSTLNSLPSTGGIGTTIFTVGGCAIMIIAAGLYFSLRRRTVK